jgi:hypothetical protein
VSAFFDIHAADLPGMFSALGAEDGTYTDADSTAAVSVIIERGVRDYMPPGNAIDRDVDKFQIVAMQAHDRALLMCSQVPAPRTRATIITAGKTYRIDRIISNDGWQVDAAVVEI